MSYKTGGQAATKLEGNFGVVYHLTLTNAANRKIWIEPEWSMIVDNEGNTRSAATILYRFNGGTWVPRDTPLSPGQAYYFAIPAVNGSATIDVVLPGGNCGNYLVYFD